MSAQNSSDYFWSVGRFGRSIFHFPRRTSKEVGQATSEMELFNNVRITRLTSEGPRWRDNLISQSSVGLTRPETIFS